MKKIIMSLAFILFVLTKQVFAKDLGNHGHVFPIIEEDILKVIEKRLSNIDPSKLNKELQDKTTKYVEYPTQVKNIVTAKENKVIYFDPSYILTQDIIDHQGIIIRFKGEVINPLEHISLSQPLIFIDGDDKKQVNFALSSNNAKIILVKGSPLELQKKHKRWIYFDQAGFITSKLGISEVPALVEQDGLKLKISIIGDVRE